MTELCNRPLVYCETSKQISLWEWHKEAIIWVFECKWVIEEEVPVCATEELWIVYFRPSVNSWECNEMAWTKGWPTLSYATTWKWHWRPIYHQSIQIMPSHIKRGSLIAGVTEAGQELFCSLKSHYGCLQTHLTIFIMLQHNLFTDRWFATQLYSFQYLWTDHSPALGNILDIWGRFLLFISLTVNIKQRNQLDSKLCSRNNSKNAQKQ